LVLISREHDNFAGIAFEEDVEGLFVVLQWEVVADNGVQIDFPFGENFFRVLPCRENLSAMNGLHRYAAEYNVLQNIVHMERSFGESNEHQMTTCVSTHTHTHNQKQQKKKKSKQARKSKSRDCVQPFRMKLKELFTSAGAPLHSMSTPTPSGNKKKFEIFKEKKTTGTRRHCLTSIGELQNFVPELIN
jgi:hypothetical protein